MRHFAADLRARGLAVDYQRIGTHAHTTLTDALRGALETHRPDTVLGILPGGGAPARSAAARCHWRRSSCSSRLHPASRP